MKNVAALMLLLAAAPALAQPARPAPAPEALATIPELSFAQQTALRRLLVERQEAEQHQQDKHRSELERIRENSAARIHDLLGDEGYRRYAQWRGAADRPPPAPGAGPRSPLPPRPQAAPADAAAPAR